eukprot:3732864-Prymnesium_polylepis.1
MRRTSCPYTTRTALTPQVSPSLRAVGTLPPPSITVALLAAAAIARNFLPTSTPSSSMLAARCSARISHGTSTKFSFDSGSIPYGTSAVH